MNRNRWEAPAQEDADALTRHPGGLVDWRDVPGKGRGVIAVRNCTTGTELERAPVIIVPDRDLLHRAERTVLDRYLLHWSEKPGREHALVGGLVMFYNHSSTPNVELRSGPEPLTMSVIAQREIAAGEELVYDYGIRLWFEPVEEPGE